MAYVLRDHSCMDCMGDGQKIWRRDFSPDERYALMRTGLTDETIDGYPVIAAVLLPRRARLFFCWNGTARLGELRGAVFPVSVVAGPVAAYHKSWPCLPERRRRAWQNQSRWERLLPPRVALHGQSDRAGRLLRPPIHRDWYVAPGD